MMKMKTETSTTRVESSPEKEEDSTIFKKDIMDKLKQQRTDFNKAIKRLDYASYKSQEGDKQTSLEDQILKLRHILESKTDDETLKKWMKYVENKLNSLYRIVSVEMNEEDALIARKNWFCLSCDRKLEPYRGKLGNSLIGGHLKAKLPDQEVMGGGMLFRTKSKYELPHTKR